MELKGRQRKTDFWKAAEERHRQIQRRYPNRASIWAGDMNVAPEAKDAEAEGIRKRLKAMAPRTAALLKSELPSQTQHEREELQRLQTKLGLVDAFEHQRDPKKGRNARARNRYSQYGHGFRKDGLGQRVDLILTDIPMTRTGPLGSEVIEVKVLTEEYGSDHLPVEAVFGFPALNTSKTDTIVSHRALGSPTQQNARPDKTTEDVYVVGARVLVKREKLHLVAASAQRP
jgi:exonuclease III